MDDITLMRLALAEAEKAAALGEVPVGAVVAKDGEPVAVAHNTRETGKNATHHAELLAIDAACQALGGWAAVAMRVVCDAGAVPHVRRGHRQQPYQARRVRRTGCKGGLLRQRNGSVCAAFQSPPPGGGRAAGGRMRRAAGGVF